jgi:uncharacterized protein YndB with AHSA1/START domain
MQAEAENQKRVLVITRVFDAPRALVFKCWTEPQHLVRWWGPNGYTTPVCELSGKVGDPYRFLMRAADGREVWWRGVIREMVEPERIVWTCSVHQTDGTLVSSETVLTVTLEEQGAKTKLTLRQGVFDSDENHKAHESGWSEALARIAAYLATGATA